uniref:Uncharacterized protein n=1 Tax=Rhizophora mucronata TaxID=61149 RepID=A0A2P2J873_RHIMU
MFTKKCPTQCSRTILYGWNLKT